MEQNAHAIVLGALSGHELDTKTSRLLAAGMPGITLFRHYNIGDREQVRALCRSIHDAARSEGCTDPPIIAVDQENGQLQALSGIVTDFPSNLALAATGDVALVHDVGAAVGAELRDLGITVNYAPVCDLLTSADNHGLDTRSFGDSPVAVGRLSAAMAMGLQSSGVAASAKHFPGKGAATADTHYEHVVIDRSREQFDESELVPFRVLIDGGVKVMMTSHATIPALSGGWYGPATRSHAVLTGLLRDELGFSGLTVTDALDMAAAGEGTQASADEASGALMAGADLLLTTPLMDSGALIGALIEAHGAEGGEGELSARMAEAANRVHNLRRWLQGRPKARIEPNLDQHRRLADTVAARSITSLGKRRHTDGNPVSGPVAVIQPHAVNLTEADTSAEHDGRLADTMRSGGALVKAVDVSHTPDGSDIDRAAAAASGSEAVVVVTAATTTPPQLALVQAVAVSASRITVVVGRNPLDAIAAQAIFDGPILCSYGLGGPALRALSDVIAGRREPSGVLPVRLPSRY